MVGPRVVQNASKITNVETEVIHVQPILIVLILMLVTIVTVWMVTTLVTIFAII